MNKLAEFARLLVQNGFRVWHHANPTYRTFLFAVIDGELGYVERLEVGGYRYNTVHRPNAQCGDGFHYAVGDLDVETMRKTCLTFAPDWYRTLGPDRTRLDSTPRVRKWAINHWLKARAVHMVEVLELDEPVIVSTRPGE